MPGKSANPRRSLARCLVICGPTAAGKTTLIAELGERLPLLAASADSRQIYRGFDIGTAKPSADEVARVPHACLDLVAPTERFTAYAWATAARTALAEATAAGRLGIVVGGAGFYVRALVHPVTDQAPAGAPEFDVHYLVVDPGPVLKERIALRTRAMLDAGWLDEIERLARTVPPNAPAWQASGYEVMRDHLAGRSSIDEALDRVIIDTRQYAKRQRTWYRHQLPQDRVTTINPDEPGAVVRAREWIERLVQATSDRPIAELPAGRGQGWSR